jgi:hypothetical protein
MRTTTAALDADTQWRGNASDREFPTQIDGRLSTYAEVKWFRHRNLQGVVVAVFCGFKGSAEDRFSA